MVKAAACVHIGIAALLFASHANAAMITSDVEGQPCDCGGYCHKSRAAMLERIQAPVRKAEVASSRFLGTKPIVLFEQRSLQPIGLRVHKKPGMHCNCHCNFDPFAWQRQFPPPFDLRNLPATPAPPLPIQPCSATAQEWPGCPAPTQNYGPVLGVPGSPGVPQLPDIKASDIRPLVAAPTGTPAPPAPPPEPQPPPPPPPDPNPPAAGEAAQTFSAGASSDCIDSSRNHVPCPPDPVMRGGWWGKALDPGNVYYTSQR